MAIRRKDLKRTGIAKPSHKASENLALAYIVHRMFEEDITALDIADTLGIERRDVDYYKLYWETEQEDWLFSKIAEECSPLVGKKVIKLVQDHRRRMVDQSLNTRRLQRQVALLEHQLRVMNTIFETPAALLLKGKKRVDPETLRKQAYMDVGMEPVPSRKPGVL